MKRGEVLLAAALLMLLVGLAGCSTFGMGDDGLRFAAMSKASRAAS